jgi:uncharacterized protein
MHYVGFEGVRRIAEGSLAEVAVGVKTLVDSEGLLLPVLIFDMRTGEVVDVDFRGEPGEVALRLADAPRGPGRPKLGVVAREVTLLPRHWEWLASQPGGASVALRRLVDEARRDKEQVDRVRTGREATYKFIRALAGNEAGFEEATRALFAGSRQLFETHTAGWPPDVRELALRLAAETWLF